EPVTRRPDIDSLLPTSHVETGAVVDDVQTDRGARIDEAHHHPAGVGVESYVREGRLRRTEQCDFDLGRQDRESLVQVQFGGQVGFVLSTIQHPAKRGTESVVLELEWAECGDDASYISEAVAGQSLDLFE